MNPACIDCKKPFNYWPSTEKRCRPCWYKFYTENPEKRFWKKVKKTSHCWIWQGAVTRGHGYFWNGKKMVYAHRFSYQLSKGPIPKGKFVCHNCRPLRDNPLCIRDSHLFAGTHQDNVTDAGEKGYLCRRLTIPQVRWIRNSYTGKRGEMTQIASKFGVTVQNIWTVLKRKGAWKYV